MSICRFMKRDNSCGRRGASRRFPTSDIIPKPKTADSPLMGSRGLHRPKEKQSFSPVQVLASLLLGQPGHGWCGLELSMLGDTLSSRNWVFLLCCIHASPYTKSDSPRLCWPPLQLRLEGKGLTQEQRMAFPRVCLMSLLDAGLLNIKKSYFQPVYSGVMISLGLHGKAKLHQGG